MSQEVTLTSNVIVIGEGLWGNKVRRIISENSKRIVGQFSARAIASGKTSIPNHLGEDCIFWIATSPELQIRILSRIGNVAQKVIIEKPIANDAEHFIELEQVLAKVQCKVFISEVWAHSVFWETLLGNIKKELYNIRRITIQRYGEASHPDIPPPLDLITHDINLLYRLSKSLGSGLKLRRIDWGQRAQLLSIEADLPSLFSVELKGGKSENGREAIWNLYGDSGLIVSANFLDNSFSSELDSVNSVVRTSVEHPIINYLDCIEESDRCQADEEQINLHGFIVREL